MRKDSTVFSKRFFLRPWFDLTPDNQVLFGKFGDPLEKFDEEYGMEDAVGDWRDKLGYFIYDVIMSSVNKYITLMI